MSDEAAIFDSVLLPFQAERTVTPRQVEEAGGLPVEDCCRLMEAFGLREPEPDEPAFTQAEADVLVELQELSWAWPADLRVQTARVYGRLLARIAQTEVQLFRVFVQPRLRDLRPEPLEGGAALQRAFERLLPLSEPLLLGVHRRWVEHEVAQEAVNQAEISAGAGGLPGTVDVALLFCDLKDFTAYANAEGDDVAVEAIDRFAATVVRERGHESRFTKALGDGFMLAYPTSLNAVSAGRRIIDAMRPFAPPGVHASVHHGTAIMREGDYFGGVVNLAARLLAAAGRDELVASRPVAEATGESFGWERAGVRRMRGMDESVEFFRLKE